MPVLNAWFLWSAITNVARCAQKTNFRAMKGLSPPQTVDGAADPHLPPAHARDDLERGFPPALAAPHPSCARARDHEPPLGLARALRAAGAHAPVPPPRVLQHIRRGTEPVADGRGGVVGHAAHAFGPVVHRDGGPLKLARRAEARTTRPPTRCARRRPPICVTYRDSRCVRRLCVVDRRCTSVFLGYGLV